LVNAIWLLTARGKLSFIDYCENVKTFIKQLFQSHRYSYQACLKSLVSNLLVHLFDSHFHMLDQIIKFDFVNVVVLHPDEGLLSIKPKRWCCFYVFALNLIICLTMC